MTQQPNNVVGTGNYKPGTQIPPNIAAPATDLIFIQEINKRLASVGQSVQIGTAGSIPAPAADAILKNLTPGQLTELGRLLKKMGYSVKENRGSIQALFLTEPELIATAANAVIAGGTGSSLISELKKIYIPLGTSGEENLPTRSIRKVSDVTANSIIDAVSQSSLRKNINDPAERAQLVKQIKEKFEEGTVTSTKKVKNLKTGKLESVSTTSGPTSEEIQLGLAKELETKYAGDFELNQTLQFHDFLNKMTSRGG